MCARAPLQGAVGPHHRCSSFSVAHVQRAPGRVGEHGPAGQLLAYLLLAGTATPRKGPCSGSRSAVTGPAQLVSRQARRVAWPGSGQPFGDGEHGQRRALLVLQGQEAGMHRDHAGGHLQRHQHRPGRAVQRARSVTAATSAAPRKPLSGANTPEVSSSRSPSCASSERSPTLASPAAQRGVRAVIQHSGGPPNVTSDTVRQRCTRRSTARRKRPQSVSAPGTCSATCQAGRRRPGGRMGEFCDSRVGQGPAASCCPDQGTDESARPPRQPGQRPNSDHRDIMSLGGLLTIIDDDPQLREVVARAGARTAQTVLQGHGVEDKKRAVCPVR